MEDWGRRERPRDGRATRLAANDRGRSTVAGMEIVRSIGGIAIASLLRRDRHGDRRPLGRATR